jgi:hypothetical protein
MGALRAAERLLFAAATLHYHRDTNRVGTLAPGKDWLLQVANPGMASE